MNAQDDIFFKLEQDDNGKWWRYCMASPECIDREQRFEKRRDIERHLSTKHACEGVHVPSLPMGRPKNRDKSKPATQRSQRQSEKRFYDEAYKTKKAKSDWIKKNTAKFERKWENGCFKLSKEKYVEQQLRNRLAFWELIQASRTMVVRERIKHGYENAKRKPIVKENESSSKENNSSEESRDDEKVTPQAHSNLLHEAPKKLQVKRKRVLDMPSHFPPRQLDFKEDSVSDGLYLQNPIPESPKVFAKSLRQGLVYHMKSTRFNLAVNFHVSLADQAMDVEASTNVMNIFALWMENILPTTILNRIWFIDSLWKSFLSKKRNDHTLHNFLGTPDLGEKVFTFIPVLERSHWTLMVLYNPHRLLLRDLSQKRPCILYFNSLGMTSSQKHFDMLKSHPILKMELLDPNLNIGQQSIEIPQQPNAFDCGYYVMTCMHYLIEGGFANQQPNAWLSKGWFAHEDVIQLKERLSNWIKSAVGEAIFINDE